MCNHHLAPTCPCFIYLYYTNDFSPFLFSRQSKMTEAILAVSLKIENQKSRFWVFFFRLRNLDASSRY